MTDEEFENELKKRLVKRSVNMSKSKKYDKVYELLLRYCRAKNLDVAPLMWKIVAKFLKSQMK